MNRDVCEHFVPTDLPCDKCKQPTALRTAAQQALEALEKYRRHLNLHGKSDAERALEAALAEFNPDWDRIEPLQENLREHMAEIQRLRAQRDALLEALKIALRQNEHDMVMTGEECRQCRAAIKAAEENT